MEILKWKEEVLALLGRAVDILEAAKIPGDEWSFGGGSALMFYYWHRESKDVDIFLSNPQFLLALSPRLNDRAEMIATSYRESSHFVKIFVGDREIDFIIAPNLTGLSPIRKRLLPEMDVPVEQPEEIVAKKFFYRLGSLKVRDIFDAYVVLNDSKRAEKLKMFLKNLLKGKERELKERILKLKKVIEEKGIDRTLQELSVSPALAGKIPENFVDVVEKELVDNNVEPETSCRSNDRDLFFR